MKLLGKLPQTTEGKLKLFILVTALIIFFVVASVGAIQLTSNPKFCSTCHEMEPEYVTWAASAHNMVSCTTCHVKPGAINQAKHKIAALEEVYKHFSKTYVTPIELSEPIDNSICLECHTNFRRVTPQGDIIFPHQKHVAEKLTCVECHSGVVHGNIERNGFTTATDYTKWTAGVGKAYMKPKFANTGMEKCIECHETKEVPVTCNTCHTRLVRPPSHLKTTWISRHGVEARDNFWDCDRCHSKTGTFVNNSNDPGVNGYIRNNTFCLTCHATKLPPGHTTDWRNKHGPQAKANANKCLACHKENRIRSSEKGLAPESSCMKCHSRPMHQGVKNNNRHPFSLAGKQFSSSCIGCHPRSVCSQCHYVAPPPKSKTTTKKP